MTLFVPQASAALVQIALFLIVPFIWWLVTARKEQGFFGWLGWRRPTVEKPVQLVLLVVGVLVAFAALGVWFVPAVVETSPSPLSGLGFAGLGAGLAYALAKTAFAEECVFRGFIGKRVAARFGFRIGNLAQAVCFGLAHAVPFVLLGMHPLIGIGTGIYSGILGAIMFWFNERLAGGSLVPSWVTHASANMVSIILTLFVLS